MQKISKNTYFTLFLGSILIGILTWNFLWNMYLGSIILGLVILLFWHIWYYYRQVISCLIFIVWGIILGFILSIYFLYKVDINQGILDRYIWLYNSYQGEVKSLHRRADFYDEYVMQLRSIEDHIIDRDIRHIVRLPKNFVLYPGQVVEYSWVMYPLEDFEGFAYKKFMLSKSIYFSTSSSSVDHVWQWWQQWTRSLYWYREQLLARINIIFPHREAIFLWGILLGARENIPKDLKEDFNNSGLTHFIAVSWFNITLCIIFITFLFWFLPPIPRILMVCLSIILFSLFVWLWAPVVRAAIMGILWYIFLQSGNTGRWITLLAFTAVVMSITNPLVLTYDVSLHLSFLAVVGIMYTQELFQKMFSWVPNTLSVREALVLTLSALSFSLPIMMFQFGQVSLLAPFANIAVTWTIPLAMLLWAIVIVADFISPLLWQGLWFVAWVFLKYDMLMVWFFGNIDWALLQLDFWIYSYYLQLWYFIILIYFLTLNHQKKLYSEKS